LFYYPDPSGGLDYKIKGSNYEKIILIKYIRIKYIRIFCLNFFLFCLFRLFRIPFQLIVKESLAPLLLSCPFISTPYPYGVRGRVRQKVIKVFKQVTIFLKTNRVKLLRIWKRKAPFYPSPPLILTPYPRGVRGKA